MHVLGCTLAFPVVKRGSEKRKPLKSLTRPGNKEGAEGAVGGSQGGKPACRPPLLGNLPPDVPLRDAAITPPSPAVPRPHHAACANLASSIPMLAVSSLPTSPQLQGKPQSRPMRRRGAASAPSRPSSCPVRSGANSAPAGPLERRRLALGNAGQVHARRVQRNANQRQCFEAMRTKATRCNGSCRDTRVLGRAPAPTAGASIWQVPQSEAALLALLLPAATAEPVTCCRRCTPCDPASPFRKQL